MKMKKQVIALGAALLLSLSGCASDAPVNVEQAGLLATAAASTDKFAGVVVSEDAVKIERDMEQTIDELFVSVGDEVRVNQKLFSYDSDALSLEIDKQELELDKLTNQIKDLTTQVKNLEKQIKNEKDKEVKATLQLQLRSVNADKTQAEFDKKTLQAEITYNKNMLKNTDVRSPIKGTIRSIDENGSPYITIQKSGAYQVKGMLNELSLNAGIMEGTNVTILSRVDDRTWSGTVTSVDYNNASGNEYDNNYGMGGNDMSSSSSYPFYITLNSTKDLLLGQHVYIQVAAGAVNDDLLRIPEGYIMDISMSNETFETTGTVWGLNPENGTLTQITVTLGEYDSTFGTYVVLSGIIAEDYLANPADPGCKEGAAVVQRSESEYAGQVPEESLPVGSELPADTDPTEELPDDAPLPVPVPGETEDPDKVESTDSPGAADPS